MGVRRSRRKSGTAPTVTLVAHRVAKVGGMERAFAELAEGLLRDSFEVHVVCHHCDLRPHGRLHVHRIRSPNRPFLLAYPLFLVCGTLVTWRHRRGIVHVLGAIVWNRADVATVQFCHHGFDPETARGRARRASPIYRLNAWGAHVLSLMMERCVYRPSRVSHLVPASEGVGAELRAHFPRMADKVSVIPNGVDRKRFVRGHGDTTAVRNAIGPGERGLLAVFVGGDWERKGLSYAIEALGASPGWRLLVVGAGPSGRYNELVREMGLDGRVRFVGSTSDPGGYFGCADAFVLPTAYEAFPLVMLEAAASSLPLLVTRVNGAREFVDDGVNGFFIERDSASISGKLNLLREIGSGGRAAIGEAARISTKPYSWEAIVAAHTAVYAGSRAGNAGS